jgi:O-antigen ligase
MKLSLKLLNYIYLSFSILWEPIQIGFLNIDGKGRIMFLLTILVFLANIVLDKYFVKKELISKPSLFWGLWVLYSAINLQIQGYYGEISLVFYFILQLFKPFLIMIIVAKETRRNPVEIFKLLAIIFTVFAILSVTILGGESERFEGRFTGKLGNAGPLNALYIIFFASLLFVCKKIKWITFIPIVIFAFAVIALAATRKAFGAAIIVAITVVLSQIRFSFKNIATVAILSAGLYYGGNYALENSSLGTRFVEGIEDGTEKNTSDIEALSFLGDRARFYINGWELFKEHPITGVGLRNYNHNVKDLNVLHTEYMVQLAECGIIGTTLFLLFYLWLGKNIVKEWKKNINENRSVLWIIAGGFCAVLFINLTAWTYDQEQYFTAFGVMIGYLKIIQNENSYTQF